MNPRPKDVTNKARLCSDAWELVAEILIPTFNTKPSVIIWGSRVFSLSVLMQTLGVEEYREVFAWAVSPDPHG